MIKAVRGGGGKVIAKKFFLLKCLFRTSNVTSSCLCCYLVMDAHLLLDTDCALARNCN